MSLERRVDKLEREDNGGDDLGFVYVSWDEEESIPDDKVILLSNGVRMTYAEVKKRYPNMEEYELIWGEDDTMTLIKK